MTDCVDDLSERDVELYVDGRRIATFDHSGATGRLRWTPEKMDFERHTVKAATDTAGKRAAES